MQQYPPEPPRPIQPTYGPATNLPQNTGQVIDQSTERLLAAAAHGAIIFGLLGFTFFVSLIITGVIWLYSRRSPYVRFHSDQAGCYQCSVILVNIIVLLYVAVYGGFAIVAALRGEVTWTSLGLVGWGLLFFILWYVATIILGAVGGVMVLLGRPFKYPFIGDWFLKRKT